MVLLGVFLIPITVSSLRGLTHIITCDADVQTPFTISTDVAASSTRIIRGESKDLCGGLRFNMSAGAVKHDKVRLTLPITNDSKYTWRGSVELKLGGTAVPVDIGEIKPGKTAQDTVDVKVNKDTKTINGNLLIGP